MSCLFVLTDGDLTDTISGPRSTASDLTSSKASTKSPTQRHNPFNEEQPEAVSSSDTTPVHATSQEKEEAQTPDQPDACTELEVIRSAGRGLEKVGEHLGPSVPLWARHVVQGRQGLSQGQRTSLRLKKHPLHTLYGLGPQGSEDLSQASFCNQVQK